VPQSLPDWLREGDEVVLEVREIEEDTRSEGEVVDGVRWYDV
jgi:hypothetical protein